MRVVIAVLLSLAALSFVLVTGTKDNYTIHIGVRTPPVEAGCSQVGEDRTDEGKVLGIFPVLHSQLSLCWFFCSPRGQSAFRQARSPLSVVWGVAYNNEV